MQTLNEMRSLGLLTHEQHTEIVSYLMLHRTPEAIQAMPQHLWCALLQADALLYPGDEPAALH
jgi:DNA-binding GntR family transcriptional regulator